jgi:hypothetical protein
MDCGRVSEKLNIEHRTPNIECLMGKDEETGIGVPCSAIAVCFSFEVGRSMFDVRRSLNRIKALFSWEFSPGGLGV